MRQICSLSHKFVQNTVIPAKFRAKIAAVRTGQTAIPANRFCVETKAVKAIGATVSPAEITNVAARRI